MSTVDRISSMKQPLSLENYGGFQALWFLGVAGTISQNTKFSPLFLQTKGCIFF